MQILVKILLFSGKFLVYQSKMVVQNHCYVISRERGTSSDFEGQWFNSEENLH